MRKPIIAGNWKMNKTPAEGVALVKELDHVYDIFFLCAKLGGKEFFDVFHLCPPNVLLMAIIIP